MMNEMILVSLKIKQTGGFFWAGERTYFMDGVKILSTSGNFIPKGRTKILMACNELLEIIFKDIKSNKAEVSVFMPKRWIAFIDKVVYHKGHRNRLLAKFVEGDRFLDEFLQQPSAERSDYSIEFPSDAPIEFDGLLDGITEQYQKIGGFFDTSWWHMLEQITRFGDIRLVKSYTTEKIYNPINHYYNAESKYTVVIDNGIVVKQFSLHPDFGEIIDIRYYHRYNCFFVQDKRKVWMRLRLK